VHGIYYYEDIENNIFPESLEWFKTEQERDEIFNKLQS